MKFLQHDRMNAIFLDIDIPCWMACCWRKTSASSPINRLLCSSPRGKRHAVEAFELEAFDYISQTVSGVRIPGCCKNWKRHRQQQRTSSAPPATVTRENDTINLAKNDE
ncbi:hypothetical protein ACLK19_15720 [Escherichia coli]